MILCECVPPYICNRVLRLAVHACRNEMGHWVKVLWLHRSYIRSVSARRGTGYG